MALVNKLPGDCKAAPCRLYGSVGVGEEARRTERGWIRSQPDRVHNDQWEKDGQCAHGGVSGPYFVRHRCKERASERPSRPRRNRTGCGSNSLLMGSRGPITTPAEEREQSKGNMNNGGLAVWACGSLGEERSAGPVCTVTGTCSKTKWQGKLDRTIDKTTTRQDLERPAPAFGRWLVRFGPFRLYSPCA